MERAERPMWQATLLIIVLVAGIFCLACGGLLAVLTAIGPVVVTLTPAVEGPAPPTPSPTPPSATVAPSSAVP